LVWPNHAVVNHRVSRLMPKAAAPTSKNRKSSKAMAFTTTTIVSFSLTLLGASVAVLSGLVLTLSVLPARS